MIIDVPFEVQGKNECGPVTLKMILDYFEGGHSKENIMDLVCSETNGVTWSAGLAKAAAQLGHKTEYYSKHLGLALGMEESDYYKENVDKETDGVQKTLDLSSEARKFGAVVEARTFELDELLSRINENCLAIVLVNWKIIKKEEGYAGHFIVLVGYDDDFVYIHHAGPKNPEANMKVERSLFDKARKVKDTDEDTIFISR